MNKETLDRCRELVAAIYGGSARRRDEVELCELLPEVLDAAERSASTKPLREALSVLETVRREISELEESVDVAMVSDVLSIVDAKIESIETGAP